RSSVGFGSPASTQVNETMGMLEASQLRVERLEARFLHARGRIRMLQEMLADQWEEPMAVAPLRMERLAERHRRSRSPPDSGG
ncbi:hypothetical protein KI387_007735, partial [Taxus chinensis]